MKPIKKIWNIRQSNLDGNRNNELEYCDFLNTILNNRGIFTKDDADRFLNPSKEHFHDPFLLKDMKNATKRIIQAIENNELIVVYGDYDVDGITSTSVLTLFLRELGANVSCYIPDRIEEGYGLNIDALDKLKEMKTSLVITVDNGITACTECTYAKEVLNIDIIITDHHECHEQLPTAVAVIDPKREDCSYPFKMLAGVGVAFKLIHALTIELGRTIDMIWKYLDIVAVGTIADIVPLIDENRVIAKLGFETIPNTWNIGLNELLVVSDYKKEQKITSGFIGFRLAPRLNAAGRMGDAKRGVELFTTDKKEVVERIAEELNNENIRRQQLEEKIFNEAIEIIEKTIDVTKEKIIVVASNKWHHGVIGIVASKITERFYRPTILLTIEDGVASGSARSVEGFSIFDAIYSTKDLLIKFGGHEMAAGLSIREENLPLFINNLKEYAANSMDEHTLIPKEKADMILNVDDINIDMIKTIMSLEPYGINNPEPTFVVKGKISDIKTIGKTNAHLRLCIKNNYAQIDGVGFGMAIYNDYYEKENEVEILCNLSINEWNNITKPQMMLKDFRFDKSIIDIIEECNNKYINIKKDKFRNLNELINIECFEGRKDFEVIYRKINYYYSNNKSIITLLNLLENTIDTNLIYKTFIIIDVFEELEILEYNFDCPYISFELKKDKKVKLEQSNLYKLIFKLL